MKTMISANDRLNRIERARHAVMVEGTVSTPWVQGWISDSWRRCIAQGLKADDALSFNPVSTSHIKQALDQNRDLIQSAKPELERLGHAKATPHFASSPCFSEEHILKLRLGSHDTGVRFEF